MERTAAQSAINDARLSQQLVVQETRLNRARLAYLRNAYLVMDGEKPSEAAVVRRCIRTATTQLLESLNHPVPTDDELLAWVDPSWPE